jgi:site-specific DNA-methyltransferase (adenine-specific)
MADQIHPDLEALAVDIELLSPLPGNPRKGDVEAVKRSYQTFGQRKPIVVRREGAGGIVIAGNHQLQAAKALGWTRIAALFTDDDDLTAKAYALADNKTADLGTYDDDLVAELLAELTVDPELLAATAYSELEVAGLLGETVGAPKNDPDETPAAPRVAHSTPTDVWLLGEHRLVVGDSTDPDTIALALDGRLADIVFTDPPYGVEYVGKTKEELTIENDGMTAAAFEAFLLEAYGAMIQHTKEGGPIYVCHAIMAAPAFMGQFEAAGWSLRQVLVWVKDCFALSRQDYNWQHEPILYGWKPGAAHPWHGPFNDSTVHDFERSDLNSLSKGDLMEIIEQGRRWSNVIREDRPKRSTEHPTMKPVKLVQRLLKNSATTGDTVLDPFGGSGSTLIAAHGLGMKAALVELDPIYADVICRRFEEHTGVTPIAEATGQPHSFVG